MTGMMRRVSCGIVVATLLGPAALCAAEQPIIHGAMIRQTKVDGFFLHYHLLSWKERELLMKGTEGTGVPGVDRSGKATHHLLLYLRGPDGKSSPPANVGFQIAAPDGSTQKTLTMEMEGGYGADVVLPAKGPYRVETTIDLGTAILNDEFSHDLK